MSQIKNWLELFTRKVTNNMIERHAVSDQRSFFRNAKTVLAGFLAFFVVLILFPAAASAAGDVPTMSGVVEGTGLPMVNLTVFLLSILRIFFGLLGVIAVALLIYGGFIWMTSAGDPAKVEKAKQIIYNTIIGLIVIFSAYAISSFLMNWLKGFSGGGGDITSTIPGGNGDWSRSALGAGPIQSVFPAPNAVNVPINTRIAVTFKVNIDPKSICDLSAGGTYCDGNEIKNVTICEIAATSSNCLPTSEFNAGTYASSTVYQASSTDLKTFIFYPKTYLGNEDQQTRTFKVVLGSGITAVATNKSVFDGLRVNYYNWAFKTNGVMDLTPPEIAKLEIYPNPDNVADTYTIGAQSTAGSASLEITADAFDNLRFERPVMLNNVPFNGIALTGVAATKGTGNPSLPADYLKLSTAGFGVNSPAAVTLSFTVDSDTQGRYIQFNASPDAAAVLGVNFSTTGVCAGKPRCLVVTDNKQVEMTGAGIIITSTGNFSDAAGSTWSFIASPAQAGDEVVLANGTELIHFLFASGSIPGEQLTKRTVGADGRTVVTTNYFIIKPTANTANSAIASLASVVNGRAGNLVNATVDAANANKLNMSARAAGANNLSLSTNNPGVIVLGGNLRGTPRITNVTPLPIGSKRDPYNNSVFQITFTEAVNPINIDSFVTMRINGQDIVASTTFTNQYKTLELAGTHPCGINSCGKTIYCWLDPNSSTTASVPASTMIAAASLQYCRVGDQNANGNEWCQKFGGTCQAGVDGGRCKLPTGLYYPQASTTIDGIIDMANNSFNGNFDKQLNAKGVLIGNAQGQSSDANALGKSGQPPYYANDASHLPDPFTVFSYENDGDIHGDNFSWSFFISTQIDTAAPLVAKILPYGDYSLGSQLGETFRDPVRFVFNGLMRMASLQPGWGYGEKMTDREWNIRYLVLKTITTGANPVGYWVSSVNLDEGEISNLPPEDLGRNDGLADYTVADIYHNPFDQAINYGPLGGNGIESITQNCFLPGNGPQNAGAVNAATQPDGLVRNKCYYKADGSGTEGCVSDIAIGEDKRVTSTNPSSYGYMNCADIDGASRCTGSNKICKIHNSTSSAASVPNGSWVVTKDCPGPQCIITDTLGGTGCCFGVCR